MLRSSTRPDTVGIRARLSGAKVGLPLVKRVSAIFSHTASLVTWHSHKQFELLFVLDGATVYEFQAFAPIELKGGHFMVVPPGMMHRGEQDLRMPATLLGIALAFDAPGAARNTPFTAQELDWMRRYFSMNALTVHPLGHDLRRTIVQLDKKLGGKKQGNGQLSLAELRIDICTAISRAACQLSAEDDYDSQFIVNAAIDYMRAHLHEPFFVGKLIDHIGYGRSRFYELFRTNTGMTPNDYLRRLRLEVARGLLENTARPVTQIAFEVGFNSSQYFSTVFQQYTGLTPSGFRSREAR
ncbi:MAG: helix-turn-helix domain-containing protein [Verrucomicrobiota bacterium]|jgi:AraC-like DNA-binding protein/mannose-6-phosphate isomerase-like protein (cupin superfamily)|nr:helix-turn-helix domain-containing protein [Verrucomicrobiota bacterium]MDP7048900.1 helix-turn-helix domain-containing protein [Verrucomicrobiota bacterium]